MQTHKKAGQWPGLPLAVVDSDQSEEFELEFEDEFELEFDDEFEFELDEEFELLFEDELELELELLLDEEFELLLELEFELPLELEFEMPLDEEFELELDSPRRFWPPRSFFVLKAVVTNLVSPSIAAVSIAVPVLTAAKVGMTNDPAATAVAASKVVSFLI
jgi:hypothetical protein